MRNDAQFDNDNYGLLIRHPRLAGRWASGDKLRKSKPNGEKENAGGSENAGEETFRGKLTIIGLKKRRDGFAASQVWEVQTNYI